MNNKAVLIIMDGYGLAAPTAGNAIAQARTPNLDRLFAENPTSKLSASGLDVGLPEGQMGNSEVGHTNIGAGRVVFQILPKMTQEIENGKFFQNPVYIKAMEDAKANRKPLHILGLMSTGGVHSHLKHVFGILDMAKQRGVEQVYVHCFLDGRHVAPKRGAGFIKDLKSAKHWATHASPPFRAVSTVWTGTSAGTVWSRATTPSSAARAWPMPTLSTPLRQAMSRT